MKKIIFIIGLFFILGFFACNEGDPVVGFDDVEDNSMYDFIVDTVNAGKYSYFLQILEKGGLDKTISAYNPNGNNYTLFLPSNDAIDKYIQLTEGISSLDDILNDAGYAAEFARYHVVNRGIHTNDFPFGAFPEPTLSNDYLTVSFYAEKDSAYYKINNQATVIKSNIDVSNGYIHEIEVALRPITFTSYDWVQQNSGYTIFKDAIELTGVDHLIDFNLKDENSPSPVTLLIESDKIFNENDINSIDDLIQLISPDDDDYTNVSNPLRQFCTYHMLAHNVFLDDFVNVSTNYSTLSDIPLYINGEGIDPFINKGKQVFDTIVSGTDTTIVDYITFLYDESNILTQSGAIHFIDQVMTPQVPSRQEVTFQFNEESIFRDLNNVEGETYIDDGTLDSITWEGGDLSWNESSIINGANARDYLEINGDFIIRYELSKIVQGRYTVTINAHRNSRSNALVEVFIDGKKIGGLVDLTSGGTDARPFSSIELGTIDFRKYETHVVEIRALIQGRFAWDYIRFTP